MPIFEQVEARVLLTSDPPFSILQNPSNPLDVDDNGSVEPADALVTINALNATSVVNPSGIPFVDALGIEISQNQRRSLYLDTNGDGELSATDIQLIVSGINARITQQSNSGIPTTLSGDISARTNTPGNEIPDDSAPPCRPSVPPDPMPPMWFDECNGGGIPTPPVSAPSPIPPESPLPSPGPLPSPDPSPSPGYSIREIKFVDLKTNKETTEINEGSAFRVDVELEGPFDSEQNLIVSADLNFDGSYQPEEIRSKVIRVRSDGYNVTTLLPIDDGIWPGNATPSDSLRVKIEFAGDSLARNMTVKNVPPAIVGLPSTSTVTFPNGSSYIQTFVSFVDPGLMDRFQESYISWGGWGDYIHTTPHAVTFAVSECYDRVWTAEFRVNPSLYPGATLFPKIVTIADDDRGNDEFSVSDLGLLLNNDDDNRNQNQDQHDFGFNDDDVKSVSGVSPGNFSLEQGQYYLSYDISKIRVWDSQEKNRLILSGGSQISGIASIPYTGQDTVWVEGINLGATELYAYWQPNGVACAYGPIGNLVKVSVVGIDVDTDSDNDGGIEHDDWEEELESHPFSLGKLLFWERPQVGIPETFEEVRVTLPVGLPSSSMVTIQGRTVEGGSSGSVEVLDQNKQFLGRTSFNGSVGTFSLARLSYSESVGSFSLFVRRPLTVTSPTTKRDADANGKPDNRLSIEIQLPNGVMAKDEVKFLVVRERDFFHMVHMMPHLRQAGASQAVYGGGSGSNGTLRLNDGKNFTMRYIPLEEMQKILEDETFSALPADLRGFARSYIYSYLYNSRPNGIDPEKPASFQAGLYRNYVTGGYSLAIRGTELNSIPELINDWLTNLTQGLSGDDPSYEAGILLAWALNSMDFMSGREFRLTGHSMGGGIASAASITNLIPADVFNSAGVHPNTLVQDNGAPIIPGTNPSMDNASFLISHYHIAYGDDKSNDQVNTPDILTFLSSYVRAMPKPPGKLVPLEGLHNLDFPLWVKSGIPKLGELPESISNIASWEEFLRGLELGLHFSGDLPEMIQSHGLEHIFFGLLHNDDKDDRWNAYERQDPVPY